MQLLSFSRRRGLALLAATLGAAALPAAAQFAIWKKAV